MFTILLVGIALISGFCFGFILATFRNVNDSTQNYYHGYREGIEAGFAASDTYQDWKNGTL